MARSAAVSRPAEAPAAAPVGRGQLALLALIGVAMSVWSFLLLRAQHSPASLGAICREGGGCAAVWSAPFAMTVERLTSVPVAGWGLVWGLAAAGLAAAAAFRVARGASVDGVVTALRLVSAAGVVGVGVLLAVIVSMGSFCAACAVAHALVLAHAAIALFLWRRHGLPQPGPGGILAAGSLVWAYLVVAFTAGGTPAALPSSAPDATAEASLRELLGTLTPNYKQWLSDALAHARKGPVLTLPPPRALRGPADAPVRFTEFTDIRCSHCAALHQAWTQLEQAAPRGSFSIESRYYPLDSACNPRIHATAHDPVRCLAPKVQICRENTPGAAALATALFNEQGSLTPDRVFELAGGDRAALEACVASPETERRLQSDVALASQYDPEGTPIVLVNGRLGSALPPFLYAMALTRGNPSHPAFSSLPPPDPNSQIH